ncbi:MAG: hypothetical protein JEZ08_21535 [Clostridiales bacterium]|nr:hypothetical protein [Clostridiales bacterium]
MKKMELSRLYRYDEVSKLYYIDVQLENYRDAYSDWDFSPFINRDLDDDLNEYLLECSYEITKKENLCIVFHILNQSKSMFREKKSVEGMSNYFSYRIRKMSNHRMRMFRNTISFLIVGSVLLFLGSILGTGFGHSMIINLVSEGFFIGGWVMIWEMFSTWFFNIRELTQTIKHYTRLRDTPIIFEYNEVDI